MNQQVVMGALLSCSFGAAPARLSVLPLGRVTAEGQPAANILDHQPLVNIPTFGLCRSPANPQVAAATAAAMGVLTPMPCVPATATPWQPGAARTRIAKLPALDNRCTCQCNWGGQIRVNASATLKTTIA
ncbi:DUF4280 domain-containing protein [Pseudomonas gingeri]|uniref:DUF4280 domain-containing protein n=1 Tax=Pseudomonas gingeri TaxID=117681 RepID=A0A7Y7XAZ2_9PSED|nr:DUF4280 domain-containing protein [Pseudomonas gingeri]NWA25920.1 DUF4280 domain-containing protein [Pseudomonas gingeri]NWB95427.1 DUF4280 domain-containing protein [Pseudomonas gingeri]NWD67436.1 DUF4280 domain-containing protein [Pseudomonas gingeri]NWD74251.1 DUF4280 domain-containing protein [Pseudomonas gingeri]